MLLMWKCMGIWMKLSLNFLSSTKWKRKCNQYLLAYNVICLGYRLLENLGSLVIKFSSIQSESRLNQCWNIENNIWNIYLISETLELFFLLFFWTHQVLHLNAYHFYIYRRTVLVFVIFYLIIHRILIVLLFIFNCIFLNNFDVCNWAPDNHNL